MELEIPKDCREDDVQIFESLADIKRNIFNLIIGELSKGECNNLSDDLYGYPYDYKLYSKDSLDPNVRILNSLLEKVEQTFEELKRENISKQNGR
mgnify:FL=1